MLCSFLHRSCVLFLLSSILLPNTSNADAPRAFPSAVGYGAKSVGGSGLHLSTPSTTVYKVRNLKDSGAGSLRECVEKSGPRVCVFEVGGRIILQSLLKIKNPYLTIAGQTAPSPGITLTNHGVHIYANNVVLQHLQILFGDKIPKSDSTELTTLALGHKASSPTYNIVIDHCSLAWAIDENFGTWGEGTRDITVSNSIIAEGFENSVHPKGPHSMGALIGDGTRNISFIRNLFVSNVERNARFKPDTSGEFINNVVYHWGALNGWDIFNFSDTEQTKKPIFLNVIGNVFQPGPGSGVKSPALYAMSPDKRSRIFVQANMGPGRLSDNGDEWGIVGVPKNPYQSSRFVIPPSGFPWMGPQAAYDATLKNVGTRPAQRNPLDARLISDTARGSGTIKDCVSGCKNSAGGWPSIPSTLRPLTLPTNPNNRGAEGYTNLQLWLENISRELIP